MTQRWRPWTALGAAALLVTLGGGTSALLLAQDVPDEPDEASTPQTTTGELPVRRRADLSGQEQLTAAREIATRAEAVSRRLLTLLDQARRERDIILVTCINDKLTQVNAHRRTLEQRTRCLQDAVTGNDESRRNHEFTVITVLGQHFTTLEQEANQCIGQDLYETGTTRVMIDIDPATPDEDPSTIEVVQLPEIPFIPPPDSGDR